MNDPKDVQTAVRAANRTFGTRFKTGDAAGIADLYSGTATLLPPGSDFVRGRANIEAFWRGAMNAGLEEATLESVEIETYGDTAIEVGTYTLKVKGGRTADQGKYLVVWKRDQGVWKLHRDVWNTSRAPVTS